MAIDFGRKLFWESPVNAMHDESTPNPHEEPGEDSAKQQLSAVIRWFIDTRLDQEHGPRAVPFFCDPERIGAFAVSPGALRDGTAPVLFQLFISLSMYQALRDVAIMRQQRSLSRNAMSVVADLDFVTRSIVRHHCPWLGSAQAFERGCQVSKLGGEIDCNTYPGIPCHVKEATKVFHRMGDMGKLPTSAWLRIWQEGGLKRILAEVNQETTSPTQRAMLLVEHFRKVHRVGRKLATMFVSALSTPVLYPGLTPWFPWIDGNELVVIDTNVARAIDLLRPTSAPKSYSSRENWLCFQAARLDLSDFHPGLPNYSPRLVQQALYAFCSKSNRVARQDACARTPLACDCCARRLCPFVKVPIEGSDET
ncbi:MAG: hypothetical protein HQL64_14520 [Magnetococcales bacterium]|nr:hypothetical protein [Magnetococcales bacterium]